MVGKSGTDIENSTEELLRGLREVVHDGEQLLQAGANELNQPGTAARARLSAALESVRETGRKLQERTVAGAKATDQAVREHPYQFMAAAFGVGLLIGLLVNRK